MALDANFLKNAINEMAKKYGKTALLNERGVVYFDLGFFKVEFIQADRWVDDISCFFTFSEDISFFFEDVKLAIESLNFGGVVNKKQELVFVDYVSEFIEQNFELLTNSVCEWFLLAAEFSYNRCKSKFPDLAEVELDNAKRFFVEHRMGC